MTEQEDSLDSFLTAGQPAPTGKTENEQAEETADLEDEFAKLLNDFINQDDDVPTTAPSSSAEKNEETLDGFLSGSGSGLDSFISQSVGTAPKPAAESSPAPAASAESVSPDISGLDSLINMAESVSDTVQEVETSDNQLKEEEKELARAVANFEDGVLALADKKNIKMPVNEYQETMLYPNYKPSVGKKIAQYLLACWDVINKYDPENMKRLSKDAGDEEYLTFAESLNDTDMQLAIISYVEILINLEICEVSYEQKKEIIQKNRIKRELYEEYIELQERKALFIQKLKEKNFPVNADKLIGNYFKAAQKDPDGSFAALTKNPAMFSPIEFDKIHPKFFGLIKVTPEDGIKANQKIGSFIKKLKV